MTIDHTLKTHFLNLYHMALSDSQIDTVELAMLYRIGEERGIEKSEIDSVVLQPDTFPFTIPEGVLEKVEYLYDFARMAWSNHEIESDERQLLVHFCKKFGFEDSNIENIVHFLIEEVKKNTPKEEIFSIVSNNI
jgi:hypothetical protein